MRIEKILRKEHLDLNADCVITGTGLKTNWK